MHELYRVFHKILLLHFCTFLTPGDSPVPAVTLNSISFLFNNTKRLSLLLCSCVC